MSWLIFALLSPLLYSFSNYGEKFLIDKKIKSPLVISIFYGLLYFLIGIMILLTHGFHMIPFTHLILLLLAGIFLNIYLVPYFHALIIDEASRVIPLFQFIPIFTLIFSLLFLKEFLSFHQLFGFFFIIIGGFIISAEKLEKGLIIPRRSLWYMVLASFLYSIAIVIFKLTIIQNTDFWTSYSYEAFGCSIGSLLLLSRTSQRKRFLQVIKTITPSTIMVLLMGTVFTFAADLSNLFAVSIGPASLVTAVGGLQPAFVLLIGILFSLWLPKVIKEDISKITLSIKIASVVILFVGIYFINS